jgi:hypothetical protein
MRVVTRVVREEQRCICFYIIMLRRKCDLTMKIKKMIQKQVREKCKTMIDYNKNKMEYKISMTADVHT